MRKIILGQALLLALFFCCFFPAPAQALQVNLNNNVQETIYVALVYYDLESNEWMKHGWFTVNAGQTQTVDLNAEIGTIYYYARNGNYSREWTVPDGHPQASADDIVNDAMYLPSKNTPRGTGHKYVNFIEFEFDASTININLNY
jgi:hypothetical protein